MHIPPERIILDSQSSSKKALLTELAGLFTSMDPDEVIENIMAREKLGSTGVGHGVAIPHCRIADLTESRMAMLRHCQGVDFDAIDGKPVHIVLMLLVPGHEDRKHLQTLAMLARNFQDASFRDAIMRATSVEEISELFEKIDTPATTISAI